MHVQPTTPTHQWQPYITVQVSVVNAHAVLFTGIVIPACEADAASVPQFVRLSGPAAAFQFQNKTDWLQRALAAE